MRRLRRKGNIGNSRCTRISFGKTVHYKAVLFVLSNDYEIQEVQKQTLHMGLGFASELVLDTQTHLVNK